MSKLALQTMQPPFQTKMCALTPEAKQLGCEGSPSFLLKPRSRISGAIPMLPHIFTACRGTNLHFILFLAFLLITIKTGIILSPYYTRWINPVHKLRNIWKYLIQYTYLSQLKKPDNVVSILTKIQAGGFGVHNLVRGTRFFSSLKHPVELWGPHSLLSMGTGVLSWR